MTAVTGRDNVRSPLEEVGVRILRGGEVMADSIIDGEAEFTDLAVGTYEVEVTGAGATVRLATDVAGGISSRVLVFEDPTMGLQVFKPAVAYDDPARSPDINFDGIVNAADLDMFRACLRDFGSECGLDPDADGVTSEGDEEPIRAAFERYALQVPGLYGAAVSEGGHRVTAGSTEIVSGQGLTEVRAEPTGDTRTIRLRIESDTGTASAGPLGQFEFREDRANPTSMILDLETGEIREGNFTIRLMGRAFTDTLGVAAPIRNGQVVFAPHGFGAYHAIVEGTLPAGFPFLGSTAFLLAKCDTPKTDVACATTRVEPGTNPSCQAGGVACSSPGAACVSSGKQGTCKDYVSGSSCHCLCSN